MKSVRYLILGCLIQFFLISVTFASSVVFDPNPYGNNFGLLVGVNDPETKSDVFRGDDAAALIASSAASYGPMARLRAQAGSDATSWMSSEYIGDSILNNANFYEPDNFLFYITGHGGFWDDGFNDVGLPSKTHYVKIGSDKFLTDKELTQYLGALPSEMNKIVIIDACFSGGFIQELKSLSNISILTSAPAYWKTAYNIVTGRPHFSDGIIEFLEKKAPSRDSFSFGDLRKYLEDNYWVPEFFGMRAYEMEFGDEITLTKDWFNFQSYQSPSYSETPIPEPATMLLFGFGLLGLAGVSRRKE